MILSNISVPLLGLVDTAVIGHLSSAHYLAGIALGSSSIAVLFWLASFLRMSTTGVIAQAFGAKDFDRIKQLLVSSLLLSILFAFTLIALSPVLLSLVANLSDASEHVLIQANTYFAIRIWSAPAALCNLVFLGLMLGMHYAKGPFYLVLFTNIINIILDIVFVLILDLGVAGAAWASVIADYSALLFATYLVKKLFAYHGLTRGLTCPSKDSITRLLTLNRDIFIRSLLLQLCFSFMTFYGARLGEVTLAANAVLLNFLMLVSFALDGIAYAAEAKVGAAKGNHDTAQVKIWVNVSMFWGGMFALGYCMFFSFFGKDIITLLTNIPEVIAEAQLYLPWLVALPIIAMSCFLFDGVFVGLTRAKEMRNAMCIAVLLGFFTPFLFTLEWENHGLWFAMSCFMALRGITLIYRYKQICHQDALLQ
jgi:MATE family multidrug resistance protein